MKIGTVNGKDYKALGLKKAKDGSGYTIEFIDHGKTKKDIIYVAKAFIPTKHAKLVGKFLLDQNIKKDTEG
jgi:hypothetical protein